MKHDDCLICADGGKCTCPEKREHDDNVRVGDGVIGKFDNACIAVGKITELGFNNGFGHTTNFKTDGSPKLYSPHGHDIAIVPMANEWPKNLLKIIETQSDLIRPLLSVVRICGNNGLDCYTIARIDTLERIHFQEHSEESGSIEVEDDSSILFGRPGVESCYKTWHAGNLELTIPDVETEQVT